MKTQLKRLKGRGGFTIVECIVAIAVFAALVLIVFMILTLARNSAKTANESEGNLAKMIQNVVGDDSYRDPEQYDSLVMQIDNTDINAGNADTYFSVSYNTVNGYKNYIQCTNTACPYANDHKDSLGNKIPYRANNTEFMCDASGKHITSQEFKPASGCKYVCPMCGTAVNNQQLRCDECETVGAHNDTGKFGYLEVSGAYYCKVCGGSNVMAWTNGGYVSEAAQQAAVDADSAFSISGLYANAIKYGDISTPADKNTLFSTEKETDTGAYESCSSKLSVMLEYTPYKSAYVPGKYTMRIQPNGGDPYNKVKIFLPPYYDVEIVSGNAAPNNPAEPSSMRSIEVTASATTDVSFILKNVRSGYAFEYDYNKSGAKLQAPDGSANLQGLFAWFGCGNLSYPRDADGMYIANTTGFCSVQGGIETIVD